MRVALSSLGLILGITGVSIGIVIIANPKPFYTPYLGYFILLFSTALLSYSIGSFYSWSQTQQKKLKTLILSDSSQLLAHWHYHLSLWKAFFKTELKSNRQKALGGFWILSIIIFSITLGVIYFNASFEWKVLQYVFGIFLILLILAYYLFNLYQNKKTRIFLTSLQPEVHMSLQGLLINNQWLISFQKPSNQLIQVEKIYLHQQNCLCFTVKKSSGEGDVMLKYHIPIPQNELENLPKILKKFRESLSMDK